MCMHFGECTAIGTDTPLHVLSGKIYLCLFNAAAFFYVCVCMCGRYRAQEKEKHSNSNANMCVLCGVCESIHAERGTIQSHITTPLASVQPNIHALFAVSAAAIFQMDCVDNCSMKFKSVYKMHECVVFGGRFQWFLFCFFSPKWKKCALRSGTFQPRALLRAANQFQVPAGALSYTCRPPGEQRSGVDRKPRTSTENKAIN